MTPLEMSFILTLVLFGGFLIGLGTNKIRLIRWREKARYHEKKFNILNEHHQSLVKEWEQFVEVMQGVHVKQRQS